MDIYAYFSVPIELHYYVKKQMGEIHMCIDYRTLNKNNILDRYPIPRIDDLLDSLSMATVLYKIDLANAYYQIPI